MFALLALIIAAVGTYPVIALFVQARQLEFGIRLALGAAPRVLFRLVFKRGLALVLTGSVVGIFPAFAVMRVVDSLVPGTSDLSPVALSVIALPLSLAGLLACLLPARHAAALDPGAVLRS